MNFHFFQSVNFSSSYGNLSFKKHGFFRKKIEFLFFFSKNNHFGKKLFTEPQSLFERASLPYFLFFNFSILKSDVWRCLLDNTYTRFRALDRFCFSDPQLLHLQIYNIAHFLSNLIPRHAQNWNVIWILKKKFIQSLNAQVLGKFIVRTFFSTIFTFNKNWLSSFMHVSQITICPSQCWRNEMHCVQITVLPSPNETYASSIKVYIARTSWGSCVLRIQVTRHEVSCGINK